VHINTLIRDDCCRW